MSNKKDILEVIDISPAVMAAWQQKLGKAMVGIARKNERLIEDYSKGIAEEIGYAVDSGVLRIELEFDSENVVTMDVPPAHWKYRSMN